MTALRQWQSEALPLVASTLRRGDRALVSACTGAGKSIFLAALLTDVVATLRPNWVVVVVVPTQALVVQLAGTLSAAGLPVGRWYGQAHERATVQVCCLPSLGSLVDDLELRKQRCALLVLDEAHRAEAPAIVEAIGRLAPRTWLGLTATPYRSETGLTHWPTLTYRYDLARALADGVLVPPIPERAHDGEGEDPITAMLAIMARRGISPGHMVASASNIPEAEHRADRLGWLAYHSGLSTPERARRIALLHRGDTPGLVHVRALSEGVDLPWLRCLALTTEHSRTRVGLVQEIGRGLRAHPGKTECPIIDPLGLTRRLKIEDIGQLVQAADDPEADDREAREAREAAEAAERIELVRTVSEVRAALERGRFIDPRASTERASPRTLSRLAAAGKGTRWITKGEREAVRLLLEQPDALSEQVAAGLADALQAARGRAAKLYQSSGAWPSGQLSLEAPVG